MTSFASQDVLVIQQPIYDVERELVCPWEYESKLREGALVFVDARLDLLERKSRSLVSLSVNYMCSV